jgi:hypothetical protein
MNFPVPQNIGKFLNSWASGGLSRRTQLHAVNLNVTSKLYFHFVYSVQVTSKNNCRCDVCKAKFTFAEPDRYVSKVRHETECGRSFV